MRVVTIEEVRSSALWAAFGDALGFISELATEQELKRRIAATNVTRAVAWRRRVGGRFGVTLELPAGCYSDDTQLRLCTARAIRNDGMFDVEAFSKVELPVWLAYALGGGRASRAAADSLGAREVTWLTNFYNIDKSRYVDSGGNGAAMRVQPHVWSASVRHTNDTILRDVIRNAVATHGHPRAIVGAALHALSLRHTLINGAVPHPPEWHKLLDELGSIPDLLASDSQLPDMWIPLWEKESRRNLRDAFAETLVECAEDLRLFDDIRHSDPARHYAELARAMGLLSAATRGSGTKTAIAANALALLFSRMPMEGLLTSANLLGSDTDTIASMAGALLGAVNPSPIPGPLLDEKYITMVAERLFNVSHGLQVENFAYPDLLNWSTPRGLVEAASVTEEGIVLAGLGSGVPFGPKVEQPGRWPGIWQWVRLAFGQTVLLRRRSDDTTTESEQGKVATMGTNNRQARLFDPPPGPSENRAPEIRVDSEPPTRNDSGRQELTRVEHSLDQMTDSIIRSDFEPTKIGTMFLEIAKADNGVDRAIGLAAILAKAVRARIRHGRLPGTTMSLTVDYEKASISSVHHSYRLVVLLKNIATKSFDDWRLEIEFPTALLDITATNAPVRSDARRSFFQASNTSTRQPLRAGEGQRIIIAYHVDD